MMWATSGEAGIAGGVLVLVIGMVVVLTWNSLKKHLSSGKKK